MVTHMATITDADRGTQLLVHTLASALAQAAQRPQIDIDLTGVGTGFFEGRDAAVAEHVRAVMADLETVIRSKRTPPTSPDPAVLARKLVESGDRYDPTALTYEPGAGFETLINALLVDAAASYDNAERNAE